MSTKTKMKSLIDEWIPSDSGWFGTWLLVMATIPSIGAVEHPVAFVFHLLMILMGAVLAFRALAAVEKRDR